ncbi:MAG: hypothetical protein H0T68_09155 [Gemmatimonadales bacterium]|nr:hypothetical protein [Gemmatimonadales bacterium]
MHHPFRLLLAGAVDYAGLFPPAGLDMPAAVRNYADYLKFPDRWALGRFVVPVARLGELESAAAGLLPRSPSQDAWQLAVLLATGSREELDGLGEFNCRHAAEGAPATSADVVELKADSVESVERAMAAVPAYLTVYIEIPINRDPADLIAAIGRAGARAKVRTGGVTPDAFPTPRDLVRFLRACADAGVPCKATAGLHHPLRASYRLSYEPDSATGVMYGFLNLFLAAAWLRAGMSDADAERLLEERSADSLRVSDGGIEWRGHRLDADALRLARADRILSFGSCSFTEPVSELRALGLAP